MPYEGEEIARWEADPELNALSNAVIGAALEMHKRLGPRLDKATYENALAIEFRLRDIPFDRQVWIDVVYKGEVVGRRRLDFLVGGRLIVEIKAVEELTGLHKAQVYTYLKLTGHQLGLLINFDVAILKDGIKRVIGA
ncbi:MAG TPA: GxxExxY protein [Tepidisphaeraceae bacterium]|jgi:GxxExxY protein